MVGLVSSPAAIRLSPGPIVIDGRRRMPEWRPIPVPGTLAAFEASGDYGRWQWRLSSCRNASGLPGRRVEMDGVLPHPVRKLEFRPFSAELPGRRVITQGIGMGECASLTAGSFTGHYQLMIVGESGDITQLTLPPESAQPAHFAGTVSGEVAAVVRVENYSGRRIDAVPVEIYTSEDGFRLMEDYARDHLKCEKTFAPPVVGWNSWDYFRWTVSEEKVLENALFIARDPVLSRRVKRIVVDDGWEYCYGEWEANPRFPSGMAKLARELTRMGFEPGLWFAPAIVEPQASIAQLDYDMLARGESGWPCLSFECMRRYGFILDPTLPKSRKFLETTFDRYAGMGYKFFKLDFLGHALSARHFADGAVPRNRIVEKIVEPIHAGIAGRAQILGCNYHFSAGNRLVDSVRIASDIHARWDSLCRNTVAVANRFWSNRKWWLNDPDFAICRSRQTSDDPDLERLLACLVYVEAEPAEAEEPPDYRLVEKDFGKAQLEILLSIVIASGGAIHFSDDMTRLNAAGLDLARRVAAAVPGETARPLDLFEKDLPEQWLQKTAAGWRLLLINWDAASPRTATFDLAARGIEADCLRDFWTDRLLMAENGRLSVELPPRSCRFVTVGGEDHVDAGAFHIGDQDIAGPHR